MIDVFWHPAVLDHDTGRGIFEGGPSNLLEVPELHPENDVRIRNIRRGRSGAAARRSLRTNATPRASAAASTLSVSGSAQPCEPAVVSP